MANEPEPGTDRGWQTPQVYAMACICLVVGLALGYLFRGSASRPAQAVQAATMPTAASRATGTPSTGAASPAAHPQMPSLDDMKRMADKKAEPLLAKLKADPNNSDLLNQVGMLYKATHQFKKRQNIFRRQSMPIPRTSRRAPISRRASFIRETLTEQSISCSNLSPIAPKMPTHFSTWG